MKNFFSFAGIVITLFFLSTHCFAQDAFSFYGLRFGMPRDQVANLFKLPGESNFISRPGHGISSIELQFNRELLLMEIKADYQKPDDPLAGEGLRRALRERFVFPVQTSHPEIQIIMDEFSNRAGLSLIFISSGLREKTIESYKQEFLRGME